MEIEDPIIAKFDQANDVASSDPTSALQIYEELFKSIKSSTEEENNDDTQIKDKHLKIKELSVMKVGEMYAAIKQVEPIVKLLRNLKKGYFKAIAKAKTAKIVRSLIKSICQVSGNAALQQEIIEESITWCKKEKRTFLRQRLETKLALSLLDQGAYTRALKIIVELGREVKKLDDKALLVEIHLIESRLFQALKNIPKAKGALTASRSSAASIYLAPTLQAEIDQQAGTLQAMDKDYKTAFSYFFEAFKAYSNLGDPLAIINFKYMILVKIMVGKTADAASLINGKYAMKYAGRELDAMSAVSKAYASRSLHEFEDALKAYPKDLGEDPLIQNHLKDLNSGLLEQNLIRIIEPYSRVEITHIASLIDLPAPRVESQLSQMILDKKLNGILDQGLGQLIIFEDEVTDTTYVSALETVKGMDEVVDSLFRRADKLSA
jgi:26S proteasome regulatory subunit N6